MSSRKKLAIIDGKSIYYRGYYAMPNLSTKDGKPTGGIYGFMALGIELLKKLQPDYVCVAWDKPKTNIRKRLEVHPGYKAGRKAAPPDFYEQIPVLHELLDALNWPLLELDDYEADDIMHTLAKKADKAGLETMLITSDLDSLQSISSHTHVYALKKGFSQIERFDIDAFEKKYSISVEQFLDLKSLKGDSSDNIPGVPGVGEKTASQLLQQYDTLDNIYDNIALIKPTTAAKLESGKEMAYMSKEVARLYDDAPVDLDLPEMDVHKFDAGKLTAILKSLEFKSLIRNLPESMQANEAMAEQVKLERNGGIKTGQVFAITDKADLEHVNKLDLETDIVLHSRSSGRHGEGVTAIIIADEKTTLVFDLRKLGFKDISYIFADQLKLIGHDLKKTLQILLNHDVNQTTIVHDTLTGAFLLDSLGRDQTIDSLADSELDLDTSLGELDDDEFIENAGKIASLIRQISEIQGEKMSELTGLIKLSNDIEWPIIPVLAKMEFAGIKLDTKYLFNMSDEFEGIISDVQQQIFGHADKEFNVSSPGQLAEVLFEDLALPTTGIKKGKTGFSTAAKELDKLRWQHPIINLITQYREYTKLKSTYVDALPKLVDKNSRVHTTFNLTISRSGRLSSTEPNLQNIPVRTEIGKKIRNAFVAEKDNVLVNADYSQFELRLAAAMAGDNELVELFNQGADIHTETAAQVYGVKSHEVTPDQRRHAKVINFGILYGMSPHGLSVATGMSPSEAKEFVDKYKELRKPIFDYTTGLIEFAKKKGYVETLFGRRRPMPDINSSNFIVRSSAERAAMNMPIQGTEADLMKMAMIELDKLLPSSARQLLQIHDSIIVECREKDAAKIEKLMVKMMENVYPELPVKLKVDVSRGKTWGDL